MVREVSCARRRRRRRPRSNEFIKILNNVGLGASEVTSPLQSHDHFPCVFAAVQLEMLGHTCTECCPPMHFSCILLQCTLHRAFLDPLPAPPPPLSCTLV